jgi:hypothetical protein
MQTTGQTDYRLLEIEPDTNGFWVRVTNAGDIKGPFPLTALRDGQPLRTEWFLPPHGDSTLIFFREPSATAFRIDHPRDILDVNRRNNYRRTSGFWPGLQPVQVRPFAPFEDAHRATLGVLPWVGWNNYDKTLLGAVLYNPPLPPRRFQYYLAPGVGLGSKRFVGLADLRWQAFPTRRLNRISPPFGWIRRATYGFSAKTFDFDYNRTDDYHSRFYRLVPQARLDLRSRSYTFQHALEARVLFIGAQSGRYGPDAQFQALDWNRYTVLEGAYEGGQRRLPNPYRYRFAIETQRSHDAFGRRLSYGRITGAWRQQVHYAVKRAVTARLFAGMMPNSTHRQLGLARGALTLLPQGFNDYRFDEVFLGRTETDGLLARQVSQSDGGFKNAFGAPYADRAGNSNTFVAALNLRADLPLKLPLNLPVKPYFDLGYYDDATPLGAARPASEQWLWSGGFLLEFFNGRFEVYFPLVNSPVLRDLYRETDGGKYANRITWSVRLDEIEPVQLLENLLGF